MDNYEEKYKKALAWMQSLYKGLHGKTKEEAEEAFPELRDEGREEKEMLDWIISYLESRALNAYIVQERENLNKAVLWLRNQSKVSVGNDLQSEIGILSKRYPEVSFTKLSRIAVYIANWQKQQIAKENMLLPFKEYDNLMDSINRRKKEGYEAGYKQGYIDSKSVKEYWKPSIAQLNALSIVSKGNAPDDIEAIVSLYNDLKKLREEYL